MTDTNEVPTLVSGIRTVGIPVSDQDRSLAFYVEVLGFEKRLDLPVPGGRRWIELGPPGTAGTTIALVAAGGETAGVAITGVETGIRLTTPDADAAHAALRSEGAEVHEVLRWPGVPAMFAFCDPDGNGLEMVEPA